MNKQQFLEQLDAALQDVSESEKEKTILYYDEMIADKIDEGICEEDAVASCGEVSQIAAELRAELRTDLPLATLIQSKVKQSRDSSSNKTLWVVLAICGFPIWLPLSIAFAAVVFSVYICVWAVIVSLFAVLLSFAVFTLAAAVMGTIFITSGTVAAGFALIAAGTAVAGLFILSAKPLYWLSKQFIGLTAVFFKKIKRLFIDKEGV